MQANGESCETPHRPSHPVSIPRVNERRLRRAAIVRETPAARRQFAGRGPATGEVAAFAAAHRPRARERTAQAAVRFAWPAFRCRLRDSPRTARRTTAQYCPAQRLRRCWVRKFARGRGGVGGEFGGRVEFLQQRLQQIEVLEGLEILLVELRLGLAELLVERRLLLSFVFWWRNDDGQAPSTRISRQRAPPRHASCQHDRQTIGLEDCAKSMPKSTEFEGRFG
jgi:hypothetical protein